MRHIIYTTNTQRVEMENLKVKIEATVYSKILLHGAKYPAFPLVGILVGTDESNQNNIVRFFRNFFL
jgi:hypothetical protein